MPTCKTVAYAKTTPPTRRTESSGEAQSSNPSY